MGKVRGAEPPRQHQPRFAFPAGSHVLCMLPASCMESGSMMLEVGMWREMKPDQVTEVEVSGHRVVTYSFGSGEEVVFLLNGGPGLPCDYLRDAHACLVDEGFRVVAFDQLGTGASDRPTDPALWTIERYVEETETVRRALGLPRVHLLGHSWGGWLAIDYALAHPDAVKSLILADTAADLPHLARELERLRAALGPETVAMMLAREAAGTIDHPEYQAAITLLNHRHVCRLEAAGAPEAVARRLEHGPLRDDAGPERVPLRRQPEGLGSHGRSPRIKAPTLIVVGLHDEITPACADRMRRGIAGSELALFRNSSHMPFYEEPERYYPVLTGFLHRQRG